MIGAILSSSSSSSRVATAVEEEAEVIDGGGEADAAEGHAHKVCGPPGETVHDVCSIDDGAAALKRLALEETEKPRPCEDVEVDGYLGVLERGGGCKLG